MRRTEADVEEPHVLADLVALDDVQCQLLLARGGGGEGGVSPCREGTQAPGTGEGGGSKHLLAREGGALVGGRVGAEDAREFVGVRVERGAHHARAHRRRHVVLEQAEPLSRHAKRV